MLVPVFMWGSTPSDIRPILLMHALIHYFPPGPCLRVPYSSVTPVNGSMTAKASAIFLKVASSVVEAWFAAMQKTVLFYDVLDQVKGRLFLLR